jgi:hypothetical protein
MDSFESIVSMLLRHQGYWTTTSYKVELTKDEKVSIGRPSCPRWELDLVAFKGSTNEALAVECKSFLDSTGLVFRNGAFEPEKTYKLFTDSILRKIVLKRLRRQLVETRACSSDVKGRLCLAIGKIAVRSDSAALKSHFAANGWTLFTLEWIRENLTLASQKGYENDVAFVVSKLLLR